MAREFLEPGQRDSRIGPTKASDLVRFSFLRSENTVFAKIVTSQSSKWDNVYTYTGPTFTLAAGKWVTNSPDGVTTLLYRMAAYASRKHHKLHEVLHTEG